MDFNRTVDLIIKDLYEAGEIIDDLKNYPGVPAFQVELAKSKCKSAAEIISFLKNSTGVFSVPVQEESKKAEEATQNYKGNNSTALSEPSAPVSISPDNKIPEDFSERIQPEPPDISKPESSEIDDIRGTVSPGEQKTTFEKKKVSAQTILADTFSSFPGGLNDKISGQKDPNELSDMNKARPVSNLYDAIGINDRFLFIREIFDGNTDNYNKAIEQLNKSACLSDAKEIIMGYTGNMEDSEASKQLFELIKRKFPGHV
ncbi:MAG TPA: hypothetical protein PLR52_02930 [Bacteroidales bacterium]|nr:hypothetical protein [Bacteroidales bacterium]HPI67612.1 hypothetical protein [Bacteroidales bacterium]HPR72083.1 hypothetical protein [Bacteroidales bacterium]